MDRDAVQVSVAAVAQRGGYKGGPRTWRREVPLGLAVLNLQKSSWGNQYYVNFGLYVRALGSLEAPRAAQCHYNARAESVDRSSETRWRELLDLDRPIEEGERRREIEDFLTGAILPFLAGIGTEAELRAALEQGRLSSGMLTAELRRHLGGRGDDPVPPLA